MSTNGYSKGHVQVTSDSLAARWLAAQSVHAGRPLAALVRRARPQTIFVENELLVDSTDTDTQQFLVDQFGAEVIPPLPLAAQPEGMDPERARSVEGMPMPATVRFSAADFSPDDLYEAAAQEPEEVLQVTSQAGAGMLALTRRLLRDGRPVMPNLVGRPASLPGRSATESSFATLDNNPDPYTWPEFSGRSQIARAWQLLQAYQQVGSLRSTVFLAIFDAGFDLDANGRPIPGLWPPDITNFVQWNLFYETLPDMFKPAFPAESRFAGGQNDEAGKEYHGNWVLSAAAAPVGNNTGAAGSGGIALTAAGPVVVPVLFKMFRSAGETLRGLQYCVAWGVDVANMSFSINYDAAIWRDLDPDFPTALWERTFRFAAEQGVVVCAAAGNDHEELPDAVVYPATRTPGVITVGAMNYAGDQPAAFSNYGSSLDIWAPGENIHVMPDSGSPNGSYRSGTSLASPLTAGVVALMKAIKSTLRSEDVKQILRRSAYHIPTDPNVVALNAYAALLDLLGGRLPDAPGEEPNNTPQTARPLPVVSPGIVAPAGVTVLAAAGDEDWYYFRTANYETLVVTLAYVPELSWMDVKLVPEDPDSRAEADLARSGSSGQIHLRVDQLAPGGYRLQVKGNGPNIYELLVGLAPRPLEPDIFEANNIRETAARFTMKRPTGGPFEGELDIFLSPTYHTGSYDANLHLAEDVDFYHIKDISQLALVKTLFRISHTDAPLDVQLLGPDGGVIQQETGKRNVELDLRPAAPECWVRVSAPTANRYVFRLFDILDPAMDPGPWDEVDLSPVPDWLPDPPFELFGWERFLQVQVTDELKEIGKLRLHGDPGLRLDLITKDGQPLAGAVPAEHGDAGSLELDLAGLEPGTYVARVAVDASPAARFDGSLGKRVSRFRLSVF